MKKLSADKAVASLLDDMGRSKAEKSQPVANRRRAAKAKKKSQKRNRVMYDIDPRIQARITEIAEQTGCPASQIANLVMLYGLAAIENGNIDLYHYPRTPSKSPKFDWNLEIPISKFFNDPENDLSDS